MAQIFFNYLDYTREERRQCDCTHILYRRTKRKVNKDVTCESQLGLLSPLDRLTSGTSRFIGLVKLVNAQSESYKLFVQTDVFEPTST